KTIPLVLVLPLAAKIMAQEAPIPYHTEDYAVTSGVHDGLKGPAATTVTAFREVVRVPGAPWLQLRFGEHDLGKESHVTITSLLHGYRQRFNAKSLAEWSNASAYFNGDALEVTLDVAPEEESIFIRLQEIVVGEWARDGQPEDLCGVDSRVASNDRA